MTVQTVIKLRPHDVAHELQYVILRLKPLGDRRSLSVRFGIPLCCLFLTFHLLKYELPEILQAFLNLEPQAVEYVL